ncbi:MAG: LamG-like jellyroll fold domain-containing protein, partial [Actinomycetota bacterium]
TGGTAGFEGVQLLFDSAVDGGFETGETLGFAVDMDPNSIAGAVKGTLDSGADASPDVGGADNDWDIGGVSGAELIGSTYTITFEDGTTATGQLQGNDNQAGAKGIASQDSADLGVTLTVNTLGEGGVGTYDASGPNVTINGPAGQTARVVLTKGFIQPGENNFTNAYAAQLDAQLNALAAADFPANNAVEFQTVDVALTGGDQDISGLFDVSQLLNGVDFGGGWTDLAVDQLPLGFVAGVIDPANGNPLGPMSAPIYLQFAENAAPVITPIDDITIDEAGEAAFAVSATDGDGDPIALAVEVTRDADSSIVDPANYTFTDNGDGTGAFSWVTGEPDDGAYTVTVTADDGTSQSTETLALIVNEVADPQPGDVLFRVNAGGAEAAATEIGGPVWTADTQQNNSPFLTNPGSNNDFPTNGQPTGTPIDTSLLIGTNPGQAVLGIERWDNSNGGNDIANEMQWAFDVAAGTEVEIRLYFAELFTGIPDADGSGDASGDRVFDVSVDGVVPGEFDDIDPYALGGNSFFSASVVSHQTVSDGTIDLAFLHGTENPAIKGIELVVAGTPDTDGPAAILSAPDVVAAADTYQFTVQYADATAVDVSTIGDLDVTVSNGAISFSTTANLVSVDVPSDGTPRTATYEITPPDGLWDPADNGTYTITLEDGQVADILGNTAAGAVLGTFDVDTTPAVVEGGQALVEITPDSGLGASTFGGSSFQITNQSVAGVTIEQVQFDLSTAILPDMVFDPTGAGGDATASPFTPNSGAAATGLVVPGDPAVDPFSVPRNGGFDVLTVDFTDFDPGEQFFFTTDVDPNSIQSVPGAGAAGAVSGYELVGSTITVTYSNGTTSKIATGSLFEDGSLGGGTTTVTSEDAPATPTIAVLGGGADQSSLPGTQLTVSTQTPTIVVTGTPGDSVSLLQMDARLFIASNDPPFDVQADELPFYANEAMSGKQVYTGTIGGNGTLEIPVTLLETPGPGGTNDGGLNHFKAVVTSAGEQSQTSETLVIKFGADPSGLPTPIVDLPGVMVFDGTGNTVLEQPHSSNLNIAQGTVAFAFNAADTSGDQGLFAKDASGFAGGGNHFVLYLDGSVLKARFQDGGNSATLEVPGIQAGTEYDVAATFDASGSKLYLDGVEVASSPLVMDWTTNVEYLQWGGRGWGSDSGEPGFDAPFEGTISNKQIYGVALTANQVTELHTGTPGGNADPVFTSAAAVDVAENTTAVVDVTASDADGDTVTYDITGGADQGAFQIDENTGALSFLAAPDFELPTDAGTDNVYDVEVSADDGNGGVTTQDIAVTVTDVDESGPNQAPVFTSAAVASVAENTTAVIDVNATDANGDTIIYSLTGGADQGAFQIDENTGALSFVNAPDFEIPTDAGTDNVYDVEVTADDGNSGVTTQDIAVTVTDVNEDPSSLPTPIVNLPGVMVFDGTDNTVLEQPHSSNLNIAQGTVAFAFNAADTSGDQGLFAKDASGFGGGGNHFALYLDGSVLKARFQDDGNSSTLNFNGIQAGTDYDVAATFDASGGKLYINGALVGSTGLVMDWTTNVEYLQWGGRGWGSDSGQPGFDAPFEGTITNKQIYGVALTDNQVTELHTGTPGGNADPVIAGPFVADVAENTVFAADVDASDGDGDTVTFGIAGGADAGAFTIDAASGVLSFANAPDFENPTDSDSDNIYEVAVEADDGNGGTDVETFAFTVTDVDESGPNQDPVFTSAAAVDVAENTTAVVDVTVSVAGS